MNRVETIFNVKAIAEEHAIVEKMLRNILHLQEQVAGNGQKIKADCCIGPAPHPPLSQVLPEDVFSRIHETVAKAISERGAGSPHMVDVAEDLCWYIAKRARYIHEYQVQQNAPPLH